MTAVAELLDELRAERDMARDNAESYRADLTAERERTARLMAALRDEHARYTGHHGSVSPMIRDGCPVCAALAAAGEEPSRKKSYSEKLRHEGGMAASGKFREAAAGEEQT